MNEIELTCVRGAQLAPWLEQLAALRIQVFREFPYLYDGSLEYEAQYLRTYLECDSSVCVLALDGERVVGASTGLALSDETEPFRRPFEQAGLDTAEIFYCAESVLLPDYRGGGLYRHFFHAREEQARALGKSRSVFCAVQRPHEHPLRPADYQSLEAVWQHFGYGARPELTTTFSWKDLDAPVESEKTMLFYLKEL